MQPASCFSDFITPLRELIDAGNGLAQSVRPFDELALELFALQVVHNLAYRQFCVSRAVPPGHLKHWTEIPAMPTSAFKELHVSCLPSEQRTTVFHSSGTTEQRPSCHFHHSQSLAIYEASLWPWFAAHLLPDLPPVTGAEHSDDAKQQFGSGHLQ